MTAQVFILKPSNARDRMKAAWMHACRFLELDKPAKVVVSEYEPTRTLDQNALMWARLTEISEQLEWPVDGKLERLDPEEWKDVLTAGLRKHQRIAAGIEGGFVLLGAHTSRMTKKEMSELLDLIDAFAAERGVMFHVEAEA